VVADKKLPRWPAWVHDRKYAWKLGSIDPLCVVTETYFRRGELLQVRLIDSVLCLFKVVDVRVIGRAGIFGWRPGFKGTYLRVEPVLALDRELNFAEAKRYIIEFVTSHSDVYERDAGIKEVIAALQAATSAQALFTAAG